MSKNNFKLTIHMVSSLDGYIAKPDNSVAWFETTSNYEMGIVDQDYEEILKNIDCYLMGAKTYELAVELSKKYGWPYGVTPTIVITNRKFKKNLPHIEFYSGDLQILVNEQLTPKYNNVWLVGGAALVGEFIREGLVNEIKQLILPIILGRGLRFYEQFENELPLQLNDVKAYKNGMVELCYKI